MSAHTARDAFRSRWWTLVRAGATFTNGKLVKRPDDQDQQGGVQQAA